MKKYRLFLVLITSLMLYRCEKNEQSIDEYMTAKIDGANYIAECQSAIRSSDEDGRDWLWIGSTNICSDSAITDPNHKEISFSILNDCLKPGVYDMEYIQEQYGANNFQPFSYAKYFNDSALMGQVALEGSISIEQLEYKKNGTIKGTFEFRVTDFVDTIWIRNGEFQIKILN